MLTWQFQSSQLTTTSPSKMTPAKMDGDVGTTPPSFVTSRRLNSTEMVLDERKGYVTTTMRSSFHVVIAKTIVVHLDCDMEDMED